jgi:DeoR/GlpR family transcriptional regulator of sugar metabolism
MIHVAPLSEIDHVVSNAELAPEFQEMLRKHDVTFSLA